MKTLTSKSKLSRSEQLRQKRQQEFIKRQNALRAESYSATHSPTVITRNYSQVVPLYQSAVIKPRKARYYNNKKSGGEYRIRSIAGLQLTPKAVSSFATIAFLITILIFAFSPTFKVSLVNAQGLQRITPSEIQSALALNNTGIFAIEKKALINQINSAFPELTNLHVSFALPGTINITATERVPVISWSSSKGTVWLDMEGAIFPVRGEGAPALTIQADDEPPTMLIMEGNGSESFTYDRSHIDPEILKTILLLTASMPNETTLLFSRMDGVGWYDERGWQVYIGLDLSNIVTKINEYEAIIGQLNSQGIIPTMVSVEHVNAPFFRTE